MGSGVNLTGPGEVRVKVHAASINYRDQLILTGQYGQTLTADVIPLSDGAGEMNAEGYGASITYPDQLILTGQAGPTHPPDAVL